MIHLTTDCRKYAALFSTFVVAASATTFISARVQEKSVLELPSVAINSPEQILESSAIEDPAPTATETAYSVLSTQVTSPVEQTPDEVEVEMPQPVPMESDLANEDVILPQDQSNLEDPSLEVLMKAPLHEAFAEVYQHDATPSPIIVREPPESINELPPEYKPDGDNVQWLPGYWAWDEDRVEFLWISGVWRDVPPGQRWVPGYWQTLDNGYRWVSGFWTSEELQELQYTPQPPASLDNGPSYAAPSDDYFYVPGNWIFRNTSFAWQTGYWAPRRQNWIYVPARYIWTPHGCIYRPAYWDYEILRRGVVFAPVCFRTPVYRTFNYRYTPNCVVSTNYNFLVHLFVRPTCNHYYFGDWYDSRYLSRNIYAWSNYYRTPQFRRAYDPLYAYYNCRASRYNNWQVVSWVQNQHRFYQTNNDFRPRHTLNAQISFARDSHYRQKNLDAVRGASFGESFRTHVDRERGKHALANHKYQHLDSRDRLRLAQAAEPIRDLSKQRQTLARLPDAKHHTKLTLDSRDRKKIDANKQLENVRRQASDSKRVLETRGSDPSLVQRNSKREKDARSNSVTKNNRSDEKQLDVKRSRENDPKERNPQTPRTTVQAQRQGTLPNQIQDNPVLRRQQEQWQRINNQNRAKQQAEQLARQTARNQTHQDPKRRSQQHATPTRAELDAQKLDSRNSLKQIQQQRDAQQRIQRETQETAQRDALKRVQQRHEVQQTLKQHETQKSAQQHRFLQRKQQEESNRAQRDARSRNQQQESLQELQQREAQKRAQQLRDIQQRNQQDVRNRAQLDARMRARQQQDTQQKHRETQKQAQQLRDAQQKAKQLESNRRVEQQRAQAQRESRQRAQLETQKRAQRDAQQRAQRQAQQRSQQNADRQRQQTNRSKKNGK